jgi:hypothetical protein
MKKWLLIAAAAALVVVGGVAAVGYWRMHRQIPEPTIQYTTNLHCEAEMKFLKMRIDSLQPKAGGVQITSSAYLLAGAQQGPVRAGYRFDSPPDEHAHVTYTIARIDTDGVLVEYESTFDHRSFGKNLITQDNGSFKLDWIGAAPGADPAE